MVADYSLQIENKAFGGLFLKIEPNTSWITGSHFAWSVVTSESLEQAETQAHVVARSWLDSIVQQWAAAVEKASKLRGLKGDDANVIMMLKPSGSPLAR